MRNTSRDHGFWLLSLSGRLGIIVWVLLLLCAGFFVLGTAQDFTESTQLMLLRLIRIFGLLFAAVMGYGALSVVVGAAFRIGFRVWRFFLSLLGIAAGAALYGASFFIAVMLSGYGA